MYFYEWTSLIGCVWVLFCTVLLKLDARAKARRPRVPWDEYETPALIHTLWGDQKLAGTCGTCGMSDCALTLRPEREKPKCQWCTELQYLSAHIKKQEKRPFAVKTSR